MPFAAHPDESPSESETGTKTKTKSKIEARAGVGGRAESGSGSGSGSDTETGNDLGLHPDDILVVIGHPFGDVVVPLGHWIATGPGPRPYVRPLSARSRATGEPLPLSVIPLRYRNDEEARQAIRDGRVEDPWAPGH